MPKNAKQLASEIDQLFQRADREGRDLTVAERSRARDLLDAAKAQKDIEAQMRDLGAGAGPVFTDPNSALASAGGPGDRFVASSGYKQIRHPDSRPQQFSSGLVEVSDAPLLMKGTLLESGAGGPGGGLVPPAYETTPDEDRSEHWWPVEPALLPEAHDLQDRGWLLRRVRGQAEWRLSDEGLAALRLDALTESVEAPQN